MVSDGAAAAGGLVVREKEDPSNCSIVYYFLSLSFTFARNIVDVI